MLLPLAVWNLEATGVSNFVSGDGVVRIAILEGGWAYSPSVSKRASARVRVWGKYTKLKTKQKLSTIKTIFFFIRGVLKSLCFSRDTTLIHISGFSRLRKEQVADYTLSCFALAGSPPP